MRLRNCGRGTYPLPVMASGLLCALFGGGFLTQFGCSSPTDPPDPPGGGNEFVLDFQAFQTTVAPILTVQGCDAGGSCHGGGIRGTLELSPQDDKDAAFDFAQVAQQVNGLDPSQSAILQKPLAVTAGGTPHSFEAFFSIQDPDYQTIFAWIQNGEFQ